jgi:hypothetical protein
MKSLTWRGRYHSRTSLTLQVIGPLRQTLTRTDPAFRKTDPAWPLATEVRVVLGGLRHDR